MRRQVKASSVGSSDGGGKSRGRVRNAFAGLAGASGLALALALFVAPAAMAAPWGYEQVTPVDKGAGSVSYVDTFRVAPDGESFLYTTNSPFDSVPAESAPQYTRYIGHRGPDRWNNLSLDPPFDTGPGAGVAFDIMAVIGSSSNLRYVVVASPVAMTPGATEGGGNLYLRDTRTRALTLIATSPYRVLSMQMQYPQGGLSVKYVDGEGKSVVFMTGVPLVDDAPSGTPPYFSDASVAYKWTPENGVEAVTVLPESEGGEVVKGFPGGYLSENGTRNSLPETGGGNHVYWMRYSQSGIEGAYVRTGDETKPVSYSRLPGESTVPLSAEIDAVSRNGEYAVFHTTPGTPALTADTPQPPEGAWAPTVFVYRYKFSDESLDYVGTAHAYGSAGVIQMTQDGQTIAFQGEIAQAEGAVEGKANTYIWHDGELQFVAAVDPNSAAASIGGSRQMLSANGRYYTFTDNSKGLAERFDQDNFSSACPAPFSAEPGYCDAVYVYDTEATGDPLQCASCRAPGVPPLGSAGDILNNNTAYMRMDARITQSLANDGTVFFTTKDALLPADQNKLEDVYAYKDGDLRLVSRGDGNYSSRFLDATDDGKTVFISTNDPIYGGDNDSAVDIYMTREGAGYPYTPPVNPPVCAGLESCHNGVPATPTQSSAGSASFEGRGNEKPRTRKGGDKVTVAKPRPASGSSGAIQVKAPGKGKLTVSGPGVKKATKSVAKAGTYTVKVTLTPAARKALEKSGQVQKTLKVSFKPSQGKAQSTTVKLTFKASAGKKGGR